MNILIVDDQVVNRRLLRVQLEAEGFAIREAGDGVEALAVLEHAPVDAIISDILMPHMDGYRLCQEVRQSPRHHALPVILYTSTFTSPDDAKLATTVGADRYLSKPATTEMLLEALWEVSAARAARPPSPVPEVEENLVFKQYSEALVNKLEEKNTELAQAVVALEKAHSHLLERTTELETANQALTRALAEVKVLSGLLPICGFCKNIRDDQNYWQSVEGYLRRHTNAQFTHGICPDCHEKFIRPQLEALEGKGGSRP